MTRLFERVAKPRPLSSTASFPPARCRITSVDLRILGVMLGTLLSVLMVAAISASAGERATSSEEGAKRPYRLDDWFDSEEFRVVTFSPDGQSVAFTRRRGMSSQAINGLEILEVRDDIWLQTAPGKEVKNLTKGVSDASGAWNPQWSPDGEYLSFLSSRGGNVTVWVWERRSDSVRQVSRAGIEFRGESGGCRWLAGPKMLCLAVLDGERSMPTRDNGRAVEYATEKWLRVRRGELAVSVVDSLAFKPVSRRLLLLDLGGAAPREIGRVLFETEVETWWLSPDSNAVALVRENTSSYPARYRARMGYPASLELRSLDDRPLKISNNIPSNVLTATLRWASDGRALAFFALGKSKVNPVLIYGEEFAKDVQHEPVASLEQPAKFWQIDLRQGTVAEVATGDIDLGRELTPPSFQWLSTGDWLFRARRLSDRTQPHRRSEVDWWVLGAGGNVRKLLRESSPPLERLETVDGGVTFFSLYARDVWTLDAATGATRNLTETFAPPVLSYRVSGPARQANLMLKAGEPRDELGRYWARHKLANLTEGVSDYVLDPRMGSISAIHAPERGLAGAAFHGPTRSVVYALDDNRGTRLWRGTGLKGASDWARLAEANSHYQRVGKYQERLLEYKTLDGLTMLAKVTLPYDYVPGRKYPVVVDSDIGYTPETARQMFSLQFENRPSARQDEKIFASAGYVYMFTSAPTRNVLDSAGRANLLLLTHGILPALDAAIAAGFADPDRFVLYGMSSFGYGALGVATQTPRFKAIVAQSSWSDQEAYPLLVDATRRYSDNPFDVISPRASYSSSELPPWRNGDHLRRNSPLSYVDRVRTPVMLIQHEFDVFPMSHAEMFFSALVLQRKPARFVRYFGEEHGVWIPVNSRDCYRQMFAWFDEHIDIERDAAGRIVFDGTRAKSRNGRPALTPGDFTRFGPAAEGSAQQTAQPNN